MHDDFTFKILENRDIDLYTRTECLLSMVSFCQDFGKPRYRDLREPCTIMISVRMRLA